MAAKLLGWDVIECVQDGNMRSIEDISEEIWKKIIEHVAEKHPFITSDIINSKYTLKDKTLTIYTGNYVKAKNIDKRRATITEILPEDITLEISKEKLATDPEVANIAAIMGGGEEIEINE